MITITIKDIQYFDDVEMEFVSIDGGIFRFEHSLEAISKWEAEWKVPFLNTKHTPKQLSAYYRAMCLDPGLTELHITREVNFILSTYMEDSRTATTFQNDNIQQSGNKVMTSEVIYSYMVAANVPFETAKWNIQRLLTLLRVISTQQEVPKKMTKEETMKSNAKLNEERKLKYNTKG